MRSSNLAFASTLLTVAALSARAEELPGWRLVFTTTTTESTATQASVKPPTDAAAPSAGPKETHSETVVLLGPSWLSIRDGAAERIYNFTARRAHHIDHDAGTVQDLSLFADIGFRDAEMKNRRHLSSVLDAAEIADNPMDIADAETVLGIDSTPAAKPDLEESTSNGTTEFRLKGEPTVRFRAAEGELPEAMRPAMRHFLVYGTRLHPRVYERLEAAARPPALLEYRSREITMVTTVRLELKESSAAGIDWKARLTGLRPASSADHPVTDLPGKIWRGKLDSTPPSFEDYQQASVEALERKNYLDAMLAQFEASIATGRNDIRRIREIREAGKDDARVGALLKGLDAKDPAEALKHFDSIDSAGLGRAHVLDVFRANSMVGAGDIEGAVASFRKALAANPYLAGAYKDLGDVLHRTYEIHTAWECWDAGRKIAPAHPMFSQIDRLEVHLAETYPRFF